MFDSIDKSILNFMYRSNRWVTTREISESTSIAWATAKDHLRDLQARGYVHSSRMENKIFWSIIPREQKSQQLVKVKRHTRRYGGD